MDPARREITNGAFVQKTEAQVQHATEAFDRSLGF
jgi:hypothetical protein